MNRKLHNVLFCLHVILQHGVVLDLFVLLKKNLMLQLTKTFATIQYKSVGHIVFCFSVTAPQT